MMKYFDLSWCIFFFAYFDLFFSLEKDMEVVATVDGVLEEEAATAAVSNFPEVYHQ